MSKIQANELDIAVLLHKALINCFGECWDKHRIQDRINDIMGPKFYFKIWNCKSGNFNARGITQAEYDKLRAFAGPHGHALWKAEQIRRRGNV